MVRMRVNRTRTESTSLQQGIASAAMALLLWVLMTAGSSAWALTGSEVSGTIALETVSPELQSVSAVTERSVAAAFSEPMLTPGAAIRGNYVASGLGAGTLTTNPNSVSGSGPYTLVWSAGEMQDGASVTVTASGVQDAVGNPINPAQNHASCLGLGIAPVFTQLLAGPAQASAGELVSITFTSSEALDGDPAVVVNGHDAVWVSGSKAVDFTYEYEVQPDDPLGLASVLVTGFDLAGNLGSLNSNAALEIIEEPAGLPLYAWPVALALLAAGIVVLAKRRRFGAALLALSLLAPASALAAPPTISGITVRQIPHGGTTQVEIGYGLTAPNGPCDITVSLSKNGGADGYIWRVTSVTGDLENVSAPSGNVILWDIRADYPEEDLPNARIRLTADDGAVLIEYYRDDDNDTWGVSGDSVMAVGPVAPYTATRGGDCDDDDVDINPEATEVCGNMIDDNCDDQIDEGCQRTLTYTAGPGGSISGPTPQTVNYGQAGQPLTAVPEVGYHFVQWSDGVLTAARTDTNVTANISVTASFALLQPPVVTSLAINNGAATSVPLGVTLNNTATNSPTDFMASESASFTGASWTAYGTAPAFTLSFGVGTRTVYFKARNGSGESAVVNDTIFVTPNTVSVAAGSFNMGRTMAGDDATYGINNELPVHSVTLGAYQLGRGEVTNKEYCDVLNWARAQGYLRTSANAPWTGAGDLYVDADGTGSGTTTALIVAITQTNCNIQYSGGVFTSKTRVGLPGTTNYSMDTHPAVQISWYGSVAFCNWLSQWQGLTPCYNMNVAGWPLTVAPPVTGGYRLPTEAEWERAAAWNGTKHWIYGFSSDTNTGSAQCTDYNGTDYVNPLGLTAFPDTSPVGWFDGIHVSPNGGVTTVNSVSPVGAYDMSGNAYEWCGDWYLNTYYSGGTMTNPTGPASGTSRVIRGGGWSSSSYNCRTAYRFYITPAGTDYVLGFRLSRSTPSVGVTTFAINNDAVTTINPVVTLNHTCWGTPTQYMASESLSFSGAAWAAYSASPSFAVSFGVGTRTVYFKVRNAGGEVSNVASDTIFIKPNTVPVAAGTFSMGRTSVGDDATYGDSAELPTHSVTLSAYQLGRGEVTNKEYCDVLNWARTQGYLYADAAGAPWLGSGNIYAGGTAGSRYVVVSLTSADCDIQYSGGVFTSKTRVGLPGTTNYSMDAHPMVRVSWYGSVAFCNWLSQWQGLTPYYDMNTAQWPLTAAPPTSGGYRLPTEAEWERAAAWDPAAPGGPKHWIYGFISDTNESGTANRCNDYNTGTFDNPLGLTAYPYTSPTGWFNGVNVNPNGSVATVNSPSPVGAYDMSGNVWEWCGDWYGAYGSDAQTNPTGPATGSYRIARGGSWGSISFFYYSRSAYRNVYSPSGPTAYIGFRLAAVQ